jgi:hypothetical protein
MTTIKTQNTNRVFRRIHDGFIMGNEIVLGKDYSTGVEREDLPEYYEEVQDPEAPTPPPPTYMGIEIPDKFLWVFPDNKFVLEGFEIPLQYGAVDVAYFQWQAFRDCLDNGNHEFLKRALMPLWDYVAEQAIKQNFIQL